ncbi:hypothetical protein DFQ28_001496 [Apophysomyces sp. BC1034]|nr:hypothetical protein DFQ30_002310 [Apophysomyces sp. BC1015]KAG0166203.1 hypothetical protein DFQ29_001133 [Apophysomyces sp. BC1021]KAG0183647.1 hypothetical protein DFQ28_001496 [Apophysomyces sp. BC1034]
MNNNSNNTLATQLQELIHKQWTFVDAEWPTITQSKYHRTSLKDIPSIGMVKEKVLQRLGVLPVFFFLVVLFGTQDYSGPYRNVEKGLLLLYHLLTGCSMADMEQFMPKSSFHQLHKEFYEKRSDTTMFSNVKIRLLSAMQKNPLEFCHVTLMLDGHDTRASYRGEGSAGMYSYKLKKSGFRTQVCMDINDMILFVSELMPCRDYNDGTMFLQMNISKKIHSVDCVALDGGYTQYINQLVDDSDNLQEKNFCCPIRKPVGVALTSSEVLFNDMFGSFRSKIEARFGELVSTFQKFGNTSPIRVNNKDTFMLQFQLACLLLNMKTFVHTLNLPVHSHHSLWQQTNFEFGSVSSLGPSVDITVNIEKKIEHANTLQQLQEAFLNMDVTDDPVDEIAMSEEGEDVYEVESILGHKGSRKHRKYYVKWKGYSTSENSWVREKDVNADDLVDEYWERQTR